MQISKEVTTATNESMQDGAVEKLIAKFEDAAEVDDEGTEFWTARDIQKLLGYSDYRNFLNIVTKAKQACSTVGQRILDHFVDVTEMVEIGSGTTRKIDNVKLTRYACYLIAQNGDARKKPVAFAQTYFAIQTRHQEIQDDDIAQYTPLSEDRKRLLLRVCPGTLRAITKFSEDEADRGEAQERRRLAMEILAIPEQPATAVKPGKGALMVSLSNQRRSSVWATPHIPWPGRRG